MSEGLKQYHIVLDDEAAAEVSEEAAYLKREAPHYVDKWIDGLEEAIASLEYLPNRSMRHRSRTAYFGQTLRHLIYQSYRIIFRVEERARVVRIFHIRHARRRVLGEPDADSATDSGS